MKLCRLGTGGLISVFKWVYVAVCLAIFQVPGEKIVCFPELSAAFLCTGVFDGLSYYIVFFQ